MVIKESDRERIELGRSREGRHSLRVLGPTGQVVAGIGASEAGSGLVAVNDANGNRSLTMSILKGAAGALAVRNEKGAEVAFLTTGANGSGLLQLTDGSGQPMVNAGVTDQGRGVVQTGPGIFHSGVGIVGLAPSYIIGNPK